MSEHTMQNSQDPISLCVGITNCDEKGNITIPPQYAYKITFQGKNCMVIPLEGSKKKDKVPEKRKRKEDNDMQH